MVIETMMMMMMNESNGLKVKLEMIITPFYGRQ